MCGIIGYTGARDAAPLLLAGLAQLEYRGYDSAGIAVIKHGRIDVRKEPGKLAVLRERVAREPLQGSVGIGHTRWATHGAANAVNAHPHVDGSGRVAVVQNGIVDNYAELKQELRRRGASFASATDTETIAYLVERHLRDGLEFHAAARKAGTQLRGANVIVLMARDAPDTLIALRLGNAGGLVVGLGDHENFVASDSAALLEHTRRVVFVQPQQMAIVTPDSVQVMTLDGDPVPLQVETLDWQPQSTARGACRHYMQKEIAEQPEVLRATLAGRSDACAGHVDLPELGLTPAQARRISRIVITGCGSALYAGLAGKLMLEALARVPVEVASACELRHADPVLDANTVLIAITQSGETADTLGAMAVARQQGATVWSIVNATGSQAMRIADGYIAMRCGPEFGVASTKAFTAPLVDLYLLAVLLGGLRGTLDRERRRSLLRDVDVVPGLVAQTLAREQQSIDLAKALLDARSCLFIGRGASVPVAREGALKLKELAYVHAEACAAGELKHGPIALVDAELPVLCIVPRDPWHERTLAQVQQVRARQGRIVVLASDDDAEAAHGALHVLRVPAVPWLLAPLVTVLPLQQLAYHSALLRGHDVDQPRNLAKSVTVE